MKEEEPLLADLLNWLKMVCCISI